MEGKCSSLLYMFPVLPSGRFPGIGSSKQDCKSQGWGCSSAVEHVAPSLAPQNHTRVFQRLQSLFVPLAPAWYTCCCHGAHLSEMSSLCGGEVTTHRDTQGLPTDLWAANKFLSVTITDSAWMRQLCSAAAERKEWQEGAMSQHLLSGKDQWLPVEFTRDVAFDPGLDPGQAFQAGKDVFRQSMQNGKRLFGNTRV